MKKVREQVDREATELAEEWFKDARVERKELLDVRQRAYGEIRAEAVLPLHHTVHSAKCSEADYVVLPGMDAGVRLRTAGAGRTGGRRSTRRAGGSNGDPVAPEPTGAAVSALPDRDTRSPQRQLRAVPGVQRVPRLLVHERLVGANPGRSAGITSALPSVCRREPRSQVGQVRRVPGMQHVSEALVHPRHLTNWPTGSRPRAPTALCALGGPSCHLRRFLAPVLLAGWIDWSEYTAGREGAEVPDPRPFWDLSWS